MHPNLWVQFLSSTVHTCVMYPATTYMYMYMSVNIPGQFLPPWGQYASCT